MLTRATTAAAAVAALAAVVGTAPTALANSPGGDVECGKFLCEVEADDPG
ncbi:hypothetical protein [Streptomyces phaeoluteigriseus]